LLEDPTVDERSLRPYVRVDEASSRAFKPAIAPNWERVEPARLEANVAMAAFNRASRLRRELRYRARIAGGWKGLRLVSEGDSWFQYPVLLTDVIDHLSDHYAVLSLDAAGAELSDMVANDELTATVVAEEPDAVLVSGGGNDLLGEGRLATALHPYAPGRRPEDYPNDTFAATLDSVLGRFRTWFNRLATQAPGIAVLCHGYDWAIPNAQRWLGAPLQTLGIVEPTLQQAIVRVMIDRFNVRLEALARELGPAVRYVDCRGRVPSGEWHDELHPTDDGYASVAEKFAEEIEKAVTADGLERGRASRAKPAPAFDRRPQKRNVDMTTTRQPQPPKNDRSLTIPFVHETPGARDLERARASAPRGRHFGGLAAIEHLAFDPESTGVAMLRSSLASHGIETIAAVASPEPTVRPELLGRAAPARGRMLEIQIGPANFLPAWFLGVGAKLATAICKLEASGVAYDGQRGTWTGTGFLVGPNLLVTNHHVINSPEVARTAIATFNYELNPDGSPRAVQEFGLDPDRIFVTSPVDGGLDFTFVWINGEPHRQFSTFPLGRHVFTVANDTPANVIQHPNGRRKEVVVQQNEIVGQDELVIHYVSDTEPGSSGAAVANNEWRLVALHHASHQEGGRYMNEGIRFSAIAAHLERVARDGGPAANHARKVLSHFKGTDALLGYFGDLGRAPRGDNDLEHVVNTYRGEASDLDVGFWNIEFFNRTYAEKVDSVAQIVLQMNLDVWALEEASPQATEALVAHLATTYGADFGWAASEPNASTSKQTTTVIWNTRTVDVTREEWPEKVRAWFATDSRDFPDLRLEAVHGKIFDRYPGLFRVQAKGLPSSQTFDFHLVPVHLKAKGEGSLRRDMASRILAKAVATMTAEPGAEGDWIIGGDYNATLASGDLAQLVQGGFVPLSAADEAAGGAFTYVKQPYRSLIDHVFLSANLARTYTADDFFIVATDRTIPDFLDVSDHRPVLVRLSLTEGAPTAARPARPNGDAGVAAPAPPAADWRAIATALETLLQSIRPLVPTR